MIFVSKDFINLEPKKLKNCSIFIMMQESYNSLAKNNAQALMPIFKILAKNLRSNLRLVDDGQDGKTLPGFFSNTPIFIFVNLQLGINMV